MNILGKTVNVSHVIVIASLTALTGATAIAVAAGTYTVYKLIQTEKRIVVEPEKQTTKPARKPFTSSVRDRKIKECLELGGTAELNSELLFSACKDIK